MGLFVSHSFVDEVIRLIVLQIALMILTICIFRVQVAQFTFMPSTLLPIPGRSVNVPPML